MIQQLFIPGPFPSLNELLDSAKVLGSIHTNGKRFVKYNKTKANMTDYICILAKRYLKPIKSKAYFTFVWYENNKRKDPDNISSAGRKIILDALVTSNIIPDDSYKYIKGFKDIFFFDKRKRNGVLVIIKEKKQKEGKRDAVQCTIY